VVPVRPSFSILISSSNSDCPSDASESSSGSENSNSFFGSFEAYFSTLFKLPLVTRGCYNGSEGCTSVGFWRVPCFLGSLEIGFTLNSNSEDALRQEADSEDFS